MTKTLRIKIDKKSRSGQSRLRTIIVYTVPSGITPMELEDLRRGVRALKPDKHGIMHFIIRDDRSIKVYNVK